MTSRVQQARDQHPTSAPPPAANPMERKQTHNFFQLAQTDWPNKFQFVPQDVRALLHVLLKMKTNGGVVELLSAWFCATIPLANPLCFFFLSSFKLTGISADQAQHKCLKHLFTTWIHFLFEALVARRCYSSQLDNSCERNHCSPWSEGPQSETQTLGCCWISSGFFNQKCVSLSGGVGLRFEI